MKPYVWTSEEVVGLTSDGRKAYIEIMNFYIEGKTIEEVAAYYELEPVGIRLIEVLGNEEVKNGEFK